MSWEKGSQDKIAFWVYEDYQEKGMPKCDEAGRKYVLGMLDLYVDHDRWNWDMYTDPLKRGRDGFPFVLDSATYLPNDTRRFLIDSFGVVDEKGEHMRLKARAYREKTRWKDRGQYDLVLTLDRVYECRWAPGVAL